MGGSGGFFHGSDPAKLAMKLRDAENKTKDQQFESDISALINKLLTAFNDRDTNAIQKHLNSIKESLQSDIDGFLSLRYGGSVAKHTYIDGLSDIDSLVLLNNSELSSKTPEDVKNYFFERLKQHFPNTQIEKGDLAITLKFKDGHTIQILPAIKHSTGYKIQSSASSNKWSKINPERFALSLRAMNQKMSGKLISVIKLTKSIISSLPQRRQISGYHTEALAIESFIDFSGQKTTKEMLSHFFDKASSLVRSPMKDKTGQSTHVDDYLGKQNSIPRKMVSDSLAQISRKIKNANAAKSEIIWKDILGND